MRLTIALLAVTSCCIPAAMVFAWDDPAEIQLDDSRWQPLPLGIGLVVVAPDGRMWLQDARLYCRGVDLSQLKQHIAEQFLKKTPRVRARLLLFEPDGRVWFYAERLQTILAYDGESWITRRIEDPYDRLQGRCLTLGGLIDTDAHRFAGGAVWLRGERGIFRYDHGTWSYQGMIDGVPQGSKDVRLSVHSAGEVAAAYPRGTSDLWLFRHGQWKKHELPKEVAPTRRLVVESADSLLYVDRRQGLRRLLTPDHGNVARENTKSGATSLGDLRVSAVHTMYADSDGRIYVAAEVISDRDMPENKTEIASEAPAGGIVTYEPGGAARVVRAKGLAGASNPSYSGYAPPILTPSGKRIWLPNGSADTSSYLFDFETQQTVGQLPDPGFRNLQAVDKTGRLFVTHGGTGSFANTIMVYTRGGRRLQTLKVSTREIGRGPTASSADGTIWTVDSSERLICFEGGVWNAVIGSEPLDASCSLIPGTGGMALVCYRGNAMICERSKIIARGGLFELLENENQRLVSHFGPDKPAPPAEQNVQVVASRSGRIWCLANRSLHLLSDGRWHDANDALLAAGSRSGSVAIVAPVGAGDRVFVSDLRLRHDGGRSFFGELEGKKLRFTDAPHMGHSPSRSLTLRGRDDALWLKSTLGFAGRTSDAITGEEAVRVMEKGIVTRLTNRGCAQLVDRAGNVWLTSIRGEPVDVVNLWRDGEIHQTLRIPGYAGGLLCNDRRGSVYAVTEAGVQHLTADAPDYAKYRLGRRFAIDGLTSQVTHQAYSHNGLIVFSVYDVSRRDRESYVLHLIQLPDL